MFLQPHKLPISFRLLHVHWDIKPGENAKISRLVTLSGKSCLKFYYHMYGGFMGELKVKLGDPVIFNKSGNQGNQWNMLQLHLQGTGPKEVRTRLNWHSIQRHIITRPYKLFQNCENSVISFTLLLYSSDEISSKAHSIPSKHYTAQFLPAGLL